jgi:hypothetical protein
MPDVNFWVVRWIDADLVNHIVSRVWAADFSSSDFSHRAAHHPSGKSTLLSALEEFGRVCGGIKKAPETSPPGTQQHLVTCSRRGRHNAALATRCPYVSIATRFVLRCGISGSLPGSTFEFVQLRAPSFSTGWIENNTKKFAWIDSELRHIYGTCCTSKTASIARLLGHLQF